MSSFKKKQDNAHTLSKADIDFYKMTGVFAIACVFVLLAIKMQDSQLERISTGRDLTHNFYMFCRTPVFWIIAIAALAGAVGWFVMCRVKKIDESKRIFTSTNCLSIVLYLCFFACCFGLRANSRLHTFFIAVTIAAAALYYVSRIYNADFIAYSVVTAVFAISIYLFALYFEPYMIALKAVIVVLSALGCVYFDKSIKKLKVSKKKKASFLTFPVYISLAIGAVCLFVRIVPTIPLARTTMLALILAQYIVFAIVYTIRLIKE